MAVCTFCSREMTTALSCSEGVLHQDGEPVAMVRWGSEPDWSATDRCGDCGVMPGGFHHLGCDVQRCAVCSWQMISCGCRFDEDPPDEDDDDDDWDIEDERVVLESYLDSNGTPTERVSVNGHEMVIHYEDIPETDKTTVDGIPCTTALRTIIDIAPELDRHDFERAVSDALQRELFTVEEAHARLAQDDMRFRPGAVLLRFVLAGEPTTRASA